MRHYYVDESGTGLRDKRSPHFVLAATGMTVEVLAEIDEHINTFKRNLIPFAEPEDYELKVRELRRGDRIFRGIPWPVREQAIYDLAKIVAGYPCDIFAVQVHKEYLTEYISTDDSLYALAFRRLADMIDESLHQMDETGMLMVDSRSDIHSSVQDRRLLDVYRLWKLSRNRPSRIIGLPWFGFSAFYVGLQIADFAAYMIDFVSNEVDTPYGSATLRAAFGLVENQVKLVRIP